MKVKVGKFEYEKSTRKGKKLMVTVKQTGGKDKTIHFGSSNMQHFKDKTKIYKNLDHNDDKRRSNYLSRSKGIKKNGTLSYNNPLSANYHARTIFW